MERARRAAERQREDVELNAEAIRTRCQTLVGFVREAWKILEPNATYVHNWHIDAICQHLEAVTDGRITRLLINVPPGSMKSLLVSVFWQAWEWGPRGLASLRYLATAHNSDPLDRDAAKFLNLVNSEWYRALWPHVRMRRTAIDAMENTATGDRRAVAFVSLTSMRGDRLVIDDPHSTTTAESETERNKVTRQFREGALNRLNDPELSAIVIIMQRLHEDDMSGIAIKLKMGFVHLMLPMEFEPERACATRIGFKDPRKLDGELLDSNRWTRETWEAYKKNTTDFAVAGQYQQRPAPREGGIFKRHWFEIVDAIPAGALRCRGWDLAASKKKVGTAPAFTAGVKLAYVNDVLYIEDVVRERGDAAEVEAMIKTTAVNDGIAVKISIPQDPGQAGKAQVLAYAKLLMGFTCMFSPETGDKEARALPVSAQAKVGNIKIKRGAWNTDFLDELCSFPASTFKDQVDALSRAFAELIGPLKSGEALLALARNQTLQEQAAGTYPPASSPIEAQPPAKEWAKGSVEYFKQLAGEIGPPT